MVSQAAREIFHRAVEEHTPETWSAYLDEACGDASERAEVERLLEVHGSLGNFMAEPVFRSSTLEAPANEPPGTVIGRYKLLEEIGEGGMGIVYIAQQSEPVRRRVALKLIKPGMDSRQILARFDVERQALALMDHPNIAKVLDGGSTEQGRPYFVMELVAGSPITAFCDAHKLAIPQRLELFAQVCRAVQHAHTKGIIHRDLKPSNVLVALQEDAPVPKVIDFGVSKAVGQPLTDQTVFTQSAQVLGTPMYMSPEQAAGGQADIDTRSDVYSLGVLLYELLTGTTPFDPDTLRREGFDELRRLIREQEPPQPSQRLSTLAAQASTTVSQHRGLETGRLRKLLRGELDWIAMKALEKDRTRRYQSAADLAEDIQRHLGHRPVEASPPSAWYRFRKYVRRNRAAIAVSATILVVLLAATGVSSWQAYDAHRARAQADKNLNNANTARKDADKQRIRAEAAGAYANAANVYHALGDDRAAENYLQKATALAPSDPWCHVVRGEIFLAQGHTDAAIEAFSEAIRFNPYINDYSIMRSKAHDQRAEAYLRKDMYAEALADFTTMVEMNPNAHYPYLRRGDVHMRMNNYADAQADYNASLKLLPSQSRVYTRRAEAHFHLQDYVKALADLRTEYEVNPNDKSRLMSTTLPPLVRCPDESFVKGLFALAADDKEALARLHEGRGHYYLEKRQYDAAFDELKRVAELSKDPLLWRRCGLASRIDFTEGGAHRERLNALFQTYVEAARKQQEPHKRLWQQRRNELGPDNPSTLEALAKLVDEMYSLAVALFETGRHEDSIALEREILENIDALPEQERNHFREQCYLGLFLNYEKCGQLDDAVVMAIRHLELVEARDGTDHLETAGMLATFGKLLLKQERYADAESFLRRCLAIREEQIPDEWRRYNAMSLLGGALCGLEKYAEAEPLLVDGFAGLEQRKDKIPRGSLPQFADAAERLATFYDATGQPKKAQTWRDKAADEAVALHRQALNIALKRAEELPDDGPRGADLNSAYALLGAALQELGRYAGAEDAFRRGVAVAESLTTRFPETPYYWRQYVDSLSRLSSLLMATGRPEEAEECYWKACARNPDWVEAPIDLGNILLQRGDLPGAIAAFQKAVAIAPEHADARRKLCDALLQQGQILNSQDSHTYYAQAEPLLQANYEALHGAEDKAMQIEALERLLRLYEAWGKTDEADRWRKELQLRQAPPN